MAETNPGKRCLVTGGAGFIGSHLVEYLLASGHTVTVIDNFSTGRTENLSHLDGDHRLQVHEQAIENHDAVRPLFEDVEWVFHLAALADIVPSIQNPLDYYRSNVEGTMSVVEAARLAGVSRLIYSASSSCYGIPDVSECSRNREISDLQPSQGRTRSERREQTKRCSQWKKGKRIGDESSNPPHLPDHGIVIEYELPSKQGPVGHQQEGQNQQKYDQISSTEHPVAPG